MKHSNVYVSKKSVNIFKKVGGYIPELFVKSADLIENFFKENVADSLNILDIGVGKGDFLIPFLEELIKRNIKISYVNVFDDSNALLKELGKAIATKDNKFPINELKCDAVYGIPDEFKKDPYKIIISTFVLHYFKNWRNLLEEFVHNLSKGSILILGESGGGWRLVEGEFNLNKNKVKIDNFTLFWKKYHMLRRELSDWDPELKTSKMAPAVNFVINTLNLKLIEKVNVNWLNEVNFQDMLLWIKSGFISALGSGLSESNKEMLFENMSDWLVNKGIDPNKIVELKSSVSLFCFGKS